VRGKEGEIFVVRRDSLDGSAPKAAFGEFSSRQQLGPTVVNINTESTIKEIRIAVVAVPGQARMNDENGGGQGGRMTSSTAFFGGQGGPNGDAAIRERSLGSV